MLREVMTMMGSQMLDILRQGVWASLSGGWYYDPHHRLCRTMASFSAVEHTERSLVENN